jgi:hypothetical protein
MIVTPSRKPKKLSAKERKELGIPWRMKERKMPWYSDNGCAERVQLCNLQKGDRFRFLNEYGKPYGPRWTVVFDMEDYEKKYGHWGGRYFPYCSMLFRKEGDENDYHIHHKDQLIVKPIHGSAYVVCHELATRVGGINLLA